MPEELDELIAAEQLGVGLQELRDMPWDDVQDVMAFRRGADIAAVSRPPGADRRIASDADHHTAGARMTDAPARRLNGSLREPPGADRRIASDADHTPPGRA